MSVLLFCASSFAEEDEAAPEHEVAAEHSSESLERAGYTHLPNHFGGFLGASFHLGEDESGGAFTLGLEYARQISPLWAAIGYVELVSSNLERDVIVAVGGVLYPVGSLAVVLAAGAEGVSKDVEVHGAVETEEETELLLRFGLSYTFPVTSTASVGPAVLTDYAGDRWTLVAGLGFGVGF